MIQYTLAPPFEPGTGRESPNFPPIRRPQLSFCPAGVTLSLLSVTPVSVKGGLQNKGRLDLT